MTETESGDRFPGLPVHAVLYLILVILLFLLAPPCHGQAWRLTGGQGKAVQFSATLPADDGLWETARVEGAWWGTRFQGSVSIEEIYRLPTALSPESGGAVFHLEGGWHSPDLELGLTTRLDTGSSGIVYGYELGGTGAWHHGFPIGATRLGVHLAVGNRQDAATPMAFEIHASFISKPYIGPNFELTGNGFLSVALQTKWTFEGRLAGNLRSKGGPGLRLEGIVQGGENAGEDLNLGLSVGVLLKKRLALSVEAMAWPGSFLRGGISVRQGWD